MTEEIIIDGVDVAGCKNYVHIKEERYKPECNCRLTTVERGYYCDTYATSICEEEDCEYKQLKRLEQENFALTQESQQKSQTICELEQENKRLKERQINWYNAEAQNYRSALEKIREIINGHASPPECDYYGSYKNACEPCALRILKQTEGKIVDIINEVLDEQ